MRPENPQRRTRAERKRVGDHGRGEERAARAEPAHTETLNGPGDAARGVGEGRERDVHAVEDGPVFRRRLRYGGLDPLAVAFEGAGQPVEGLVERRRAVEGVHGEVGRFEREGEAWRAAVVVAGGEEGAVRRYVRRDGEAPRRGPLIVEPTDLDQRLGGHACCSSC